MMATRISRSQVSMVGGAKYIGRHKAKIPARCEHGVTILDNLSAGFRDADRFDPLIEGELTDESLLKRIFNEDTIVAVLHVADLASHVGKSMCDSAHYYRNNLTNTPNLVDAMHRHDVPRFISFTPPPPFGTSSGTSSPMTVANEHGGRKCLPTLTGGYGLRSMRLRYFNFASADLEGQPGERRCPQSYLISMVIAVTRGQRGLVAVYRNDCLATDGTYIGVWHRTSARLLIPEQLPPKCDTLVPKPDQRQELFHTESNRHRWSCHRPFHPRRNPQTLTRRASPYSWPALKKMRLELCCETRSQELETIIRHAKRWARRKGLDGDDEGRNTHE